MEIFYDAKLLWLFLSSVPIGIFAIVLGGSMFLSLPIFQLLFPEMTLGAIIGNIKMGSVVRNAGAVSVLRKHLNARKFIPLILILSIGAIMGAFSVSFASQKLVLPVILFAVLVTEGSKWFSKHIPKFLFYLIAFLIGIFGGIIGAGLLLLIIAILRIAIPEDHNIYHVRSLGIFSELIINISSVVVFWFTGQLVFHVWVVWAIGGLIGGFIGGKVIKHTGKLSPKIQKNALRAMFVFAVVVAIIKLV